MIFGTCILINRCIVTDNNISHLEPFILEKKRFFYIRWLDTSQVRPTHKDTATVSKRFCRFDTITSRSPCHSKMIAVEKFEYSRGVEIIGFLHWHLEYEVIYSLFHFSTWLYKRLNNCVTLSRKKKSIQSFRRLTIQSAYSVICVGVTCFAYVWPQQIVPDSWEMICNTLVFNALVLSFRSTINSTRPLLCPCILPKIFWSKSALQYHRNATQAKSNKVNVRY